MGGRRLRFRGVLGGLQGPGRAVPDDAAVEARRLGDVAIEKVEQRTALLWAKRRFAAQKGRWNGRARAAGQGGANQELAAGACLDLDEKHSIAICALDTDGTDGPTSLAGALTDGSTLTRATQKGYDLYQELMAHNVSAVLKSTEDAVITGPTGTNVNDLVICVIL